MNHKIIIANVKVKAQELDDLRCSALVPLKTSNTNNKLDVKNAL